MTKTIAAQPQRLTVDQLAEIVHHVTVSEIDKENEFQAGYMYDAVCHEQAAFIDFQQAKMDLESTEGQAWIDTKNEEKAILAALDPKERSAAKLTVDDKKAHVDTKPVVLAAKQKLADAEAHYEKCKGLTRAFQMRQKNIDNLTQFVLGKYVSFNKA